MASTESHPHLSRIETQWTAVFEAHRGVPEAAADARTALLRRYGGAVHRYLLGSLRDPDAAEELAQEFALRFLRGDFKGADPGRGRFRDFLKRSIYHLMVDHHRARRARPGAPADGETPGDGPGDWAERLDATFVESWREEVLARTWSALSRWQERTGRPLFSVLRARVDEPELDSEALARRLSERLGRPVDANWTRVNLHRARDRFVELLIEEVSAALTDPSPEDLEQELIELGLYERCRSALRRAGRTS